MSEYTRENIKTGRVSIRPWHDAPEAPCGCGGVGSLEPYNPSGWYGPRDATLFCPACGTGWYGTDEQIEQALVSEAWWNAWLRSGMGEGAFAESEGGA